MEWIVKQTQHNIAQFDKSMENAYPESAQYVSSPERFHKRIVEQTHYLDAVETVAWGSYLKPGCTVLDLGGGIGWLSAYLSRFDSVSRVYLLDSSRHFLENMMPGVVEIMQGRAEKIIPVEALLSPLFFEDRSLDVVVICSTLHHADNMEALLVEVKRVLKDDGYLLILNETPVGYFFYATAVAKQFVKILANTLARKYQPVSPSISSSGYVYDQFLFDRMYPMWFWKKAIAAAGFESVHIVNTGLGTLKGSTTPALTHFICRKQ